MPRTAGDLAKTIGIEIVSRAVASAVTKGDIIGFDSNGAIRVASITNTVSNVYLGFGVTLETVTTGNCRVAVGNTYIYARSAAGDVQPYELVGAHTTTLDAGGFSVITFATTATNSVTFLGRAVGRYMGHEGEEDNQTAVTTAEAGILRLGL